MNLLYEAPPDTVLVGGKSYSVYTDFRDWLRFFDMQEDDALSQRDKLLLMLEWYKEKPPPELLRESIEGLIRFASRKDASEPCREKEPQRQSTDKVLSWSYDAAYVYAAFLSVYRIDLLTVKEMHWHVFLALFDALPDDTPIKQRMGYRAVNLSAIKDKNERKRIRRIQDSIRIPHEDLNAYQCGEFFG